MPADSLPVDCDRQHAPLNALDAAVDSPAIRRLIEEVRLERPDVPRSYNRTHNRHNR
ncbi:MAG: YhhA family cyclophane-containing RiPP [Caulobacteraceae bacterium]